MIKNRSKITIQGLNQEKALNNLTKITKIFNYKREAQGVSHFEIEYKHRWKVKKFLQVNNIKVLSWHNFGVLDNFFCLLKNWGVMVGLVFLTVVYAFQYNFVANIVVFGAEMGLKAQITSFVDDLLEDNIKSKIQTKELENAIRGEFEELSSVSVAVVGQSIVISVNNSTLPEEMQGEFQPITSQYDGIIQKINLIQGTPAVNEGDIVKKGDVLVYPYVIDGEGERVELQAKAEIIANIWVVGKQTHYDACLKTVRTGKVVKKREVYLNNLLIYQGGHNHNFEKFEIEIQERDLTKNLMIPFKLKTIYLYEVETIEINEDFYDVKEKIVQNAREKALIFLQENEIIKEENIVINEGSGWHEVAVTITLTRNIGG